MGVVYSPPPPHSTLVPLIMSAAILDNEPSIDIESRKRLRDTTDINVLPTSPPKIKRLRRCHLLKVPTSFDPVLWYTAKDDPMPTPFECKMDDTGECLQRTRPGYLQTGYNIPPLRISPPIMATHGFIYARYTNDDDTSADSASTGAVSPSIATCVRCAIPGYTHGMAMLRALSELVSYWSASSSATANKLYTLTHGVDHAVRWRCDYARLVTHLDDKTIQWIRTKCKRPDSATLQKRYPNGHHQLASRAADTIITALHQLKCAQHHFYDQFCDD